MAKKYIKFVERNIHGAWVVYGALGFKQYYYYTKKEAVSRYIKEAKESDYSNRNKPIK